LTRWSWARLWWVAQSWLARRWWVLRSQWAGWWWRQRSRASRWWSCRRPRPVLGPWQVRWLWLARGWLSAVGQGWWVEARWLAPGGLWWWRLVLAWSARSAARRRGSGVALWTGAAAWLRPPGRPEWRWRARRQRRVVSRAVVALPDAGEAVLAWCIVLVRLVLRAHAYAPASRPRTVHIGCGSAQRIERFIPAVAGGGSRAGMARPVANRVVAGRYALGSPRAGSDGCRLACPGCGAGPGGGRQGHGVPPLHRRAGRG
jgi:hypothetical protein